MVKNASQTHAEKWRSVIQNIVAKISAQDEMIASGEARKKPLVLPALSDAKAAEALSAVDSQIVTAENARKNFVLARSQAEAELGKALADEKQAAETARQVQVAELSREILAAMSEADKADARKKEQVAFGLEKLLQIQSLGNDVNYHTVILRHPEQHGSLLASMTPALARFKR